MSTRNFAFGAALRLDERTYCFYKSCYHPELAYFFLWIGLIPVFAILLVYHREGWALVVFTIAGVSDGIDGFVARRFKQESELERSSTRSPINFS